MVEKEVLFVTNLKWTNELKDDADFIQKIAKKNRCRNGQAVRFIISDYKRIIEEKETEMEKKKKFSGIF